MSSSSLFLSRLLLFSLLLSSFVLSHRFVAQFDQSHSFDFNSLAQTWGAKYVGPMKRLPSIHVFESIEGGRNIRDLNLLQRDFPEGKVLWVESVEPIRYRPIPIRTPELSSRWDASDPAYSKQWHIPNVRADKAWDMGYSGKGVTVSVLDDGVNKASTDLGNLDVSNSWNFITGTNDPTPSTQDCIASDDQCEHGTFCATLAVGQTNNYCGVGIGPGTVLQGFAILPASESEASVTITDYVEAVTAPTDVSSNSYGPVTCETVNGGGISCSLAPVSKLEVSAFDQSLTERDGKGVIFLFASGNDGDIHEDTNLQGTLTLRGLNAVGASTPAYVPTSWSCPGAGLMCIAPGLNMYGSTILVGAPSKEVCQTVGSGTSFSTPVVAGSMSLLLEANPDLSWRDVQHLIVRSSYQLPSSSDFVKNAAGRQFSYHSGFGVLDIYGAVYLATNWTSFPQEYSTTATNKTKFSVSSSMNYYLGISTDLVVESVNLVLDISCSSRGGLKIQLISPAGTTHTILNPRPDYESNYAGWPTLARGFWDERSPGWWKVRVTKDSTYVDAGKVQINGMSITIYGTKPEQYPNNPSNPPEHDDPEPGETSASSRLYQEILMMFILVVGILMI